MVASNILIQISASQISRVFIRRFYMQDQSTSMDIHIFFHILSIFVFKKLMKHVPKNGITICISIISIWKFWIILSLHNFWTKLSKSSRIEFLVAAAIQQHDYKYSMNKDKDFFPILQPYGRTLKIRTFF